MYKNIMKQLRDNELYYVLHDIYEKMEELEEKDFLTYVSSKYKIDITDEEYKLTEDDVQFLKSIDSDTLKELDLTFKDYDIIETDDFEDARELTEFLATSDDKFLTRFVPILSLVILFIGFGYLFLASFTDLLDVNRPIVQNTIEFIKTVIIMVVSFWVGSSVGSKNKTDQMSKLLKNK